MTPPHTAIREAGPADADLVADILADAFADDAMMGWTMGGLGRARPLFNDLARRVYLQHGFGHIIDEAAVTLWLPANARVSLSLVDELSIAMTTLRRAGFGALARLKRVGDILTAHRPLEPHYYLFAVGVRDGVKGKGYGGRAIREGLERADAEGAIAYLENSKGCNTPLYRRLGFEVTGRLPVPDGAPTLLSMIRPQMKESAT